MLATLVSHFVGSAIDNMFRGRGELSPTTTLGGDCLC